MSRDITVEAVDAIVEEFKVLVPDAQEHLSRVEVISNTLAFHLDELKDLSFKVRSVAAALTVAIEALDDETVKARSELVRRAMEIDRNTARLQYPYHQRVEVGLGAV